MCFNAQRFWFSAFQVCASIAIQRSAWLGDTPHTFIANPVCVKEGSITFCALSFFQQLNAPTLVFALLTLVVSPQLRFYFVGKQLNLEKRTDSILLSTSSCCLFPLTRHPLRIAHLVVKSKRHTGLNVCWLSHHERDFWQLNTIQNNTIQVRWCCCQTH
eukprot:m.242172 g.242172  ORF g.242172 m.242172 type:complete len:159 (-) comp30522_c0_seq1:291-767(-)